MANPTLRQIEEAVQKAVSSGLEEHRCLHEERWLRFEKSDQQVWKNKDDILTMQIEKKTIQWGKAALYMAINAAVSLLVIVTGFYKLMKYVEKAGGGR